MAVDACNQRGSDESITGGNFTWSFSTSASAFCSATPGPARISSLSGSRVCSLSMDHCRQAGSSRVNSDAQRVGRAKVSDQVDSAHPKLHNRTSRTPGSASAISPHTPKLLPFLMWPASSS